MSTTKVTFDTKSHKPVKRRDVEPGQFFTHSPQSGFAYMALAGPLQVPDPLSHGGFHKIDFPCVGAEYGNVLHTDENADCYLLDADIQVKLSE